ncbi:HupE/UreJ family protein [Paenibacillus foliorum]|nr:HupE/UreJ family protein [Paenibacillus foliorum]
MYVNLGLEHIITGYDHLLFLFSLIIISQRFSNVLKIVTAFTIAHSITLTLAALGYIPLYPKWVESGIALTIAYVAIENFFVKTSKWRWLLTFGFGLIHGLGFASSISQIGFDRTYSAVSLISFNVGIELGQLAVVGIVLPLLLKYRSRKEYKYFFNAASACTLIIALYWFVERIIV